MLQSYLYDTMVATPNVLITNCRMLLPSIISLAVVILVVLLLLTIFKLYEDKIFYAGFMCAVLATGYIISFSPTIFASGSRIFFIGNMLMICLVGKLYDNIIQHCIGRYRKFIIGFSTLLIINSLLVFLMYYFKYTQWVLWL